IRGQLGEELWLLLPARRRRLAAEHELNRFELGGPSCGGAAHGRKLTETDDRQCVQRESQRPCCDPRVATRAVSLSRHPGFQSSARGGLGPRGGGEPTSSCPSEASRRC